MIAPSVVNEVRRRLAEGTLSQRKIAKLTGVSRGTVGAIASGKRRDTVRVRKPWEEEPEEPLGPPERCATCGSSVFLPCRLCRLRKLMAAFPISRLPDRSDEPLKLKLRDEHRARYEQVRARRMEQERSLAHLMNPSSRGGRPT